MEQEKKRKREKEVEGMIKEACSSRFDPWSNHILEQGSNPNGSTETANHFFIFNLFCLLLC